MQAKSIKPRKGAEDLRPHPLRLHPDVRRYLKRVIGAEWVHGDLTKHLLMVLADFALLCAVDPAAAKGLSKEGQITTSVNIPQCVLDAGKMVAKQKGVSFNELINQACKDAELAELGAAAKGAALPALA